MRTAVNKLLILLVAPFLLLLSCGDNLSGAAETKKLPILGFKDVEIVMIDGEKRTDTIYHTINNFYFTSHRGEPITHETVKGRIYVADFFFTHCPTICPIMTDNMKTLHLRTEDIEELIILSHTIDPERDTLERLNQYIKDHGIDTKDNWFFLRGSQSYTYDIGKDDYLINATVDRAAEGGFLHSEHFVLVDRQGRIRGMYEGTDTSSVHQLEEDIRFLIATEYDNS